MVKFCVPKNSYELAAQVATLLNKYNRLKKVHNAYTIGSSPARYLLEFSMYMSGGVAISKVVGCIGLTSEGPGVTRLHHLCVDENFRRKGIARGLIASALKNCQKGIAYMETRDDNKACHRAAFHNGFIPTKVTAKVGYNLVTLSRSV